MKHINFFSVALGPFPIITSVTQSPAENLLVRQISIRIYHRSPMQTEKSQPEDFSERMMPETRFTEFPALSVGSRIGISRSTSETDIGWLYCCFTSTVNI